MQQESQNRPFKFRRSPRPGRASVQLVGCSLSGHRRRFWSLIDLLVRLRAACASGDSESPLAIPGPGGGCPGHPERVDVPLNSTGPQPPSGRGPAASTQPRPFCQGGPRPSRRARPGLASPPAPSPPWHGWGPTRGPPAGRALGPGRRVYIKKSAKYRPDPARRSCL